MHSNISFHSYAQVLVGKCRSDKSLCSLHSSYHNTTVSQSVRVVVDVIRFTPCWKCCDECISHFHDVYKSLRRSSSFPHQRTTHNGGQNRPQVYRSQISRHRPLYSSI